MEKLQSTLARITPVDKCKEEEAQKYLDSLTKPIGSLGVLEDIARKVAGITRNVKPSLPQKTSILMAGDHGVVAEGVSAYPQEVTPQMVLNFLTGGAAMNVLARHAGAKLIVVDIGVAADLPEHPILINRKIAFGTANMACGPAMTKTQAVAALEVGIEIAQQFIDEGTGLFGTGEMGIGNTTPSAAITALYKGCSVADVCGRGTGLDDQRLQRKINVIEKAIKINKPDPRDALDVLAKLGGFEIAGMAGVMLAAAANRVPVLLDGFISSAAAIIAANLHPHAAEYMLASHLSEEPGHAAALSLLNLEPFLHMKMRLGEGTGTALAMTMVDAALKIVHEMASFSEAGISGALA
ncbi:MAG: nicotinate-nucleotide--dimethylbenzimidazole phosphoribosyltransferase [Firmicutes bacterium]|nr:nicotinate-nucleotide--dimethylbenzimidazole phosphoribosyltransferase [Bacillota bacterium]